MHNIPNTCIYHGNCADGFGAAWVFKRHSSMEFNFYAARYQQEPPWELIDGRNVYLVDFSYKLPVMLQILERAKHVVLIDHHKSALEDLNDIMLSDRRLAHKCSLDHSGAMLAWKYWKGSAEPPALIRHIEDRDLWRFALPNTKEIQAAVFSYPYDFEVWDKLMEMHPDDIAAEGEAILRKHLKDVRELIEGYAFMRALDGHLVPWLNCPYFHSSDAGHYLCENSSSGRGMFAVCYYDGPDGRNFSLRSGPDGMDVSAIAVKFGGGGHFHAAGFHVPFTHELARPE